MVSTLTRQLMRWQAMAAAVVELDLALQVDFDLDLVTVHFLHKGRCVEWDARFLEGLVQLAAHKFVTC